MLLTADYYGGYYPYGYSYYPYSYGYNYPYSYYSCKNLKHNFSSKCFSLVSEECLRSLV